MTYVSRHTRLLIPRWLEPGDEGWIYALRRKRSDHKLKLLNSCEDLRAWVDDECLRTQHFIESMSYSEFLGEAPFGIFGRFIPISYLCDFVGADGLKEGDAGAENEALQDQKAKEKPDGENVDLPEGSAAKPSELRPEEETVAVDEGNELDKKFYGKESDLASIKEEESGELSPKDDLSFCKEEKDYQASLDLLCKYCELLCQAVNKLEEVEYTLNSTHNQCTCDNSKYNDDISFEEFFSNCQKYMVEDSETRVDSCCHCDPCDPCDPETNSTEDSLPPTPEPSIGPSISCDQFLKPEKQDHAENELLRRISNFKQRLAQIEEHWRDLNEEIKISQRNLEEYRESCNCQETEKLKELREKLQQLVFERGCISRQKCEALRDLTNLKYSGGMRFTKSDVSVTRDRDLNFGKFPSCQCGFEEFSTSIDTCSSERKSRISTFSPLTRDSINGKSFNDQTSCRESKLGSIGSPRRAKSESEIDNFIRALNHYEKRISGFENLCKGVEMLKQKAMRADYFQGELKRVCECRDQAERESEEEKRKLCLEIEGLKCVINHLKVKLDETCQEVDYWQCKDEEITALEKEADRLKRKLCRSQGDYKEAKKYSNTLEQLITLQRNQIERLMLQIHKMSKFMGSEKKVSEISCKNKVRSKSLSPDGKKCVRSSSTKIIRTAPDENQAECCCLADEPSNYPHPRISRKMEPRASMKYDRKKVGKKCQMPVNQNY